MEYFVLLDPAGNPLQLFRSMLEDPIIHRIHQKLDGSLVVQVIRVGKENFSMELRTLISDT